MASDWPAPLLHDPAYDHVSLVPVIVKRDAFVVPQIAAKMRKFPAVTVAEGFVMDVEAVSDPALATC